MKLNAAIIVVVCSFIVDIALFDGFFHARKRSKKLSNSGATTADVSAQTTSLESVNSDLGFDDEEVAAGGFKINSVIGAASEGDVDIIAIDNINKDFSFNFVGY